MKKMLKEIKRTLAILLAVAMVVTLMPEMAVTASAAEISTDEQTDTGISEETDASGDENTDEPAEASEDEDAPEGETGESDNGEESEAEDGVENEAGEAEETDPENTEDVQEPEEETGAETGASDVKTVLEEATEDTQESGKITARYSIEEGAWRNSDNNCYVTYESGVSEDNTLDETAELKFAVTCTAANLEVAGVSYTFTDAGDYSVEVGAPDENGVYTISSINRTDGDTTYTGNVVLQIQLQMITYNVSFQMTNAAVTVSRPEAQEDGSYDVSYGGSIQFTVEAEEGYKLRYVSTTEDTEGAIAPNKRGIYTYTPAADTVIYVMTEEKASIPISFFRDDVHIEVKEVAEVNGTTVLKSINEVEDIPVINATEDEIIQFTAYAKDGSMHSVTSVTAVDSDVEPVAMTSEKKTIGDKEYTVYTLDLTDMTKEIGIEVENARDEAKANMLVLSVVGNASGYTAKILGNIEYTGTYKAGDKFSTEDTTMSYRLTAADNYEITKVLAVYDGKEEAAQDLTEEVKNNDGEYHVDFTAGRVAELRVTIEGKATEAANTITFNNRSDYMTYQVTVNDNVTKVAGKTNVYAVAEGTREVQFSVTAKGKYAPVVEVNGVEQEASSVQKSVYTYSVAAQAFEEDAIVVISHQLAQKTITVSYDDDEVTVDAKIGGKAYEADNYNTDEAVYTVDVDASLVLVVTPLENCQLTGATTKTGTAAAKKASVKAAGSELTVKATDDVTVTVSSKGIYRTILKETFSETPLTAVKDVYTVSYGTDLVATVKKGVMTDVAVSKAEVKAGKKTADTAATISDDGREVVLNVSEKDAGKTLTVNLYTKTAEDKEEKAGTITISVPAKATKYAVTGVKNGKLTQTVDTVASYAITTTPKAADVSRLEAVVESESNAATAEIWGGKLIITTEAAKAAEGAAVIKLLDNGVDTAAEDYKEGDEIVASFTLNTAAPAWAGKDTPGVKLSAADDVSLTLALSATKKMTQPNTGSLYYKVEVTPQEGAPETSAAKTEYIRLEGASQTEKITVNSAGFGNGAAAKYDLKVTVVQTLGEDAPSSAEDEAFASKTKDLKNAATKAPAYETKLTLKKGTTTVYTGQQEVLIATAQFSKNTTFTDITVEDITECLIVDGEEEDIDVMSFTVKDGKIYANVGYYTGKFTVEVTASAAENTKAATAAINVTVVQGITSIGVEAASDSIYKADKKAATLKVTPTATKSAKTKKFTYEIVGADSEDGSVTEAPEQIQAKVSVKNGTVTVKKDYVVSNEESQNQFKVKVTAADYKGNEVYGLSEVITIKAEAQQLGGLCIAKQTEKGYEVLTRGNSTLSTDELQGATLLVLKKGTPERDVYAIDSSYIINPDEVRLAVKSSNNALSVSESHQISVSKAAKNVKLTVSTTDGGKKSVTLDKLTITYGQREELGLSAWVKTPDNKETYCIGQNDEKMTFIGTADTEILLNLMQKTEEDGEWEVADDNNVLDYKLDVKGAKVLSKNRNDVTLIANTAKATITLSYKKGTESVKQVYTITNEGFSTASAPTVKAAGSLVSYSIEEQLLQYTLKGSYQYKDKFVMVKADAADRAKQTGNYQTIEKACLGINGYMPIEEDGTFNLVFEACRSLPTGSYKLQFTFGSIDEDGNFVADTKAVTATVKVGQRKADGSYKPVSSVKLALKDKKAGVLKGTGKNVVYEYYGEIKNANINGQSNRFAEFFEIDYDWDVETEEETYYLKLKDNLTEEQLSYITSAAAKNDRIGYISYSGTYGTAGVWDANSGTAKVTVSFADTMGTYAISKATILSIEPSAWVDIYRDNKLVDVDWAYVEGDFTGYATGSHRVFLTADEVAVGKSTVAVYVIPAGSYYSGRITAIADENGEDSEEYKEAVKKYGIKLVTEITVKDAATTTNKINFQSLKQQFGMSKYRIQEHKYWAAVGFTSSYQYIDRWMNVGVNDERYEDLIQFTMYNENYEYDENYMYILVNKAKLDEMELYGQTIKVKAYADCGEGPIENFTFELTMPGKALMTYEEAVASIKAQQAEVEAQCQISYWEGATEEEITEQAADMIWQAVRMHTPGDSDVDMDYPVVTSYTAPTTTQEGSVQVKLNLDLWDDLFQKEKEDSITYTLTIPKLATTPADMQAAVEAAAAAYTAANDTTAADFAQAVRKEVSLPSHLRLTVSDFVMSPATTEAEGSLSYTITIFDVKYGGEEVTVSGTLTIAQL